MQEFLQEYIYFLTPLAGWISAQGLKFFISLRKNGITLSDLWQSGGSPSSHTSFVSAVVTIIGLVEGIDTAVFGLALTLLAVVMYDAVGVRRANGQNTLALVDLIKETKSKYPLKLIRHSDGHNPLQVLAGLATGVATGVVLYLLIY